MGKNSSLVFAKIDDTIADNNVYTVGSDARSLEIFDDALGEGHVALVVAERAGVMLFMRARHLLGGGMIGQVLAQIVCCWPHTP